MLYYIYNEPLHSSIPTTEMTVTCSGMAFLHQMSSVILHFVSD